jgi:hypothetical protein
MNWRQAHNMHCPLHEMKHNDSNRPCFCAELNAQKSLANEVLQRLTDERAMEWIQAGCP